jgi:hypothetical protein
MSLWGSGFSEGLSILAFMLCLFSNPCSCAQFLTFLGTAIPSSHRRYIAERRWFQYNDCVTKLALRELFLDIICASSFNLVVISHFLCFFVAAAWYLLQCEGWCFPTHQMNIFSFWTPQPWTLWCRNFLLNFTTPCIISNVNITGTKKGSIMK